MTDDNKSNIEAEETNSVREIMYEDGDGNYRYRGFWSGFGDQ